MIEKLRRKPIETETILWDGTQEAAEEIGRWTYRHAGENGAEGFVTAERMSGVNAHAALWVQHNRDWVSLPVGYRVAKELDGTGFYPLSPEGVASGYESP